MATTETLRSSGQETKFGPEKKAAIWGIGSGLAAAGIEAFLFGTVKYGPLVGIAVGAITWYQARLGKRRSP